MDSYFQTRFTPDPARAGVWRHIANYLQRWVDPDSGLLDLAAGYGDFTRSVSARPKVAIDRNPSLTEFVALGSTSPDTDTDTNTDRIEAVIADATDLSRFDDGGFATVFASNFIEHLEHHEIDALVPQIWRVLRPGGRLILIQPNFRLAPRRYFDDYTHRTIWTDQSLTDLLAAAGFEIEHCEPRFLPLTMKSRLSFGHRLVPLYLRLPFRPLAGQMLVVARRPTTQRSDPGR